ncbi:hypothetical protein M0657_012128 [Pyricularia oryzae]|uniref:Uncharacterized protein n=1 Tax=Pyricularia oryzae TaxID=318829 RepID=A0A4P7NW08_PYROR|nr:hypothetical protein M0657_012128 [Pyricularia oryzae]QBZ66711.1 hypothetical protein PoMZ_13696 [Pyricularia oryzae]
MVVSLLRAETLPSARIVPRHKPIVILVLKPFPSHIGEPFSLRLVGDNTGWMSLHESKSVGRNIPGSILGDPGLDMTREAIEDSTIQFGNQYVSFVVLLELACPMFLGDGLMPSWEKKLSIIIGGLPAGE